MKTLTNNLAILHLGCLLLVLIQSQAQSLYQTDFSNFTAGEDQLVGTDGWMGSNIGEGVHGIDSEAIVGLGHSAFLGFNPPSTDLVSVYRPIDQSLLSSGSGSVIEFNVVMGISDSFNGQYDRFYFSLYDPLNNYLAALVFDNTNEGFGIWVSDGVDQVYTDEEFLTDVLYDLTIVAKFSENSWSAYLDDIPLFVDRPLTAVTGTPEFGDVAVEWEITDPNNPGDNWLLFDDWEISLLPASTPSLPVIQTFTHDGENVAFTWPGNAGDTYQVEYSSDLQQWHDDLPNSLISAGTETTNLSFTDNPGNASMRFYRVRTVDSTN